MMVLVMGCGATPVDQTQIPYGTETSFFVFLSFIKIALESTRVTLGRRR